MGEEKKQKVYLETSFVSYLKGRAPMRESVASWQTASRQWWEATISFLGLREKLHNPDFKGVDFDPLLAMAKGNQRDYATINQLTCISNMENINAVMINDGIPQSQRLKKLNEIAIQQMRILSEVEGRKYLK